MYCYSSTWQPIFNHLQALGVLYHPGLPPDVMNLYPHLSNRGC